MTEPLSCLILAPTGNDAGLIGESLDEAGLTYGICADLDQLCVEVSAGTGVIIISQAALDEQASQRIRAFLAQEPPWSVLPVVLLISRMHDPAQEGSLVDLLGPKASLALVECPCYTATLVSTVRSSLHLRQHQYQLRALLEQLDATAQDLARSNAELFRFASAAAHDLQAPLRLIAMYLELIEEQLGASLNDQLQEYFQQVVGGSLRMRDLITALLDYAKVGAAEPTLSAFPLQEVLSEALHILQPAIEEAQAEISIGDLPYVRADRPLLLLLFQNLIGNAIKYRSPERRLAITITADDADPRAWRIHITDTGIGIAPEHAERIFLAFQRLPGSQAIAAGHGIGLATCKRIVELHGGRIWVEASTGPGSHFVFSLAKPDASGAALGGPTAT
ncbi:MAG: sensor histidine kinase [Planctomycetota bacterium]